MVWGSLLGYCSKQEKWDCCFNCEFTKGGCTRSENHDGVLDVGSLLPSSIILKLACKSGPLLPYFLSNILALVKYIVEKENCGICQLVALKQVNF